jgi:formate hydrogenlyase transcriptional activator
MAHKSSAAEPRQQSKAKIGRKKSFCFPEDPQTELQAEREKLCKLAVNTFSLLGETRVTQEGMVNHYFGDVSPEEKLGVFPGSNFSSTKGVMESMHPEDLETFKRRMGECLVTGDPFEVIFRIPDGHSGWRWLKSRACSLGKKDGIHSHWLHDTVDITDLKTVEESLRKTVEELGALKTQLQKENSLLREESCHPYISVDIIGKSETLGRVLQQVSLVAPTSSTVLISGETGTGKELVASAIHQSSARSKQLFVTVNCAALPATLIESELFGHEKGAFTGAHTRRIGRFEQADQGTLFLDEVGELSLETQAKMLRVLQFGEFTRLGGDTPVKVNVRVIAASNRDLEAAVRAGQFRSDLYHRLAVFPINLPPLRERTDDIPLLASFLVMRKARKLGRKIEEIPDAVIERLKEYSWPGNIRELENVLERAIILSPGPSLSLEAVQLRDIMPAAAPRFTRTDVSQADTEAELHSLEACERMHIVRVCEATNWKIKGPKGAAERLRMNPSTLYSRMKKLGIQRK